MEAAKEMSKPGYAPARAYRIAEGWTVISSWLPLDFKRWGILEVASNLPEWLKVQA